jgi:hypothetical protein
MEQIDELITLANSLILVGAAARVAMIYLQIINNADEAKAGKQRIKNVLTFVVFAELILGVSALIKGYYT